MNSHLTGALMQAREQELRRAAERRLIVAELETGSQPRRLRLREALAFLRPAPRQPRPSVAARKTAGV
jgi:hypothetical protein